MESQYLSSIFRQLFQRCSCQKQILSSIRHLHSRRPNSVRLFHGSTVMRVVEKARDATGLGWQRRQLEVPPDLKEEFSKYKLVTAQTLSHKRTRPKMCKMLVRDYIDDALYNPNYGYFSKEALIFSAKQPFKFTRMKHETEFADTLQYMYKEFEDALDEDEPSDIRQLWHTPTELFKPYYGETIARNLYENYLDWYPTYDLLIYELGAGNGTLMVNVLDYFRTNLPDIYIRTKFKIIEISPRLADRQRKAAEQAGHADHVEIINTSFFNFDTLVSSPCFFLALEVFDNFAHDMIRYDPQTEQPMQGYLLIDKHGDFHEFFTHQLDSEVERYLDLRSRVYNPEHDSVFKKLIKKTFDSSHTRGFSKMMDSLKKSVYFRSNLSPPEFLPIRMMQFFELLNYRFPHHRLIMSDFHYLPDVVEGINAPIVQTRYKRISVPVTTLFVHQGYFDIIFPVNFELAKSLYELICGKFSRVMTHEDFMKQWAELADTTTQNGENPMLIYYKNASVLCTY